MKKSVIAILIFLLSAIVIGGVVWFKKAYKTPAVVNNSPVNNEPATTTDYIAPAISLRTTTMDVSKWKTYRVEEYGFSFKYPPEWTEWEEPAYRTSTLGAGVSFGWHTNDYFSDLDINRNIYVSYNFNIQNYTNAPSSTEDFLGAPFPTLTQKQMDAFMIDIKNNPKVNNYNNVFVVKNDIGYSPQGGDFVQSAEFFIDKNYVRLDYVLPVILEDCYTTKDPATSCRYLESEEDRRRKKQDNIHAKLEEINKNTSFEEVKKSIDIFNKIVGSLQKL